MKRKILPIMGISAILLCCHFMPAWSDNETISEGKAESHAAGLDDHVEVTGIVQGPEPVAVVNRELVKEGSWIDGAKVLKIDDDSVTFELDGRVMTKRVGEGVERKTSPDSAEDKAEKSDKAPETSRPETSRYEKAKKYFAEASVAMSGNKKEEAYRLYGEAIEYARVALTEIDKLPEEKYSDRSQKKFMKADMDELIENSRVRMPDYGSSKAQFIIPVLVVNYFPVEDGKIKTKQKDLAPSMARSSALSLVYHVIDALQKGSTYHGYKNPKAKPSLKYRIADILEIRLPLPVFEKNGAKTLDYHTMMTEDIDIRKWVEDKGVKEVWICYHEDTSINGLWESNMSSRYGDISNSDRNPRDLPVLKNTYTVYNYNYQREDACAVENHMHQIEVIFKYVDRDLFDNQFVGKPGEGRCGWSHRPPNSESDYDWRNKRYVESDIEDWKPEGGTFKQINSSRWGNTAMGWFIFWMQNLPGQDNAITYRGRPLRNWWAFIGDFDQAMEDGSKLEM